MTTDNRSKHSWSMIIRGQKGGTADERMIAGFATAFISPGFDLVRSKSIECDGRTADRCELSLPTQPNFGIKFHLWERVTSIFPCV